MISIHALRVEGDWIVKTLMLEGNDFYPRPPGGGRLDAVTGEGQET